MRESGNRVSLVGRQLNGLLVLGTGIRMPVQPVIAHGEKVMARPVVGVCAERLLACFHQPPIIARMVIDSRFIETSERICGVGYSKFAEFLKRLSPSAAPG